MEVILVDTDVYSYLSASNPARGTPYKRHLDGNTLALSFITVGELYAGYRKRISRGEWRESHLRNLETLLESVVIIPFDVEICKIYGDLRGTLKSPSGSDRVIDSNDLWIAACALFHSLKLCTNNRRHFEGIPGLEIICEAPPTR